MTTSNQLAPRQANPPVNPSTGVTSLMQACQQGKDVAVRQLLHVDPVTLQFRDRTGKTALHYCAENSSLNCIEQLLNSDPSLLSARDEDGYTALHLATIAGNKSVVKYLLSKGADVHAKDSEDHTAVHWATVGGEVELLDILIDAGADPSTPDIHGAYPIHYGAQMCGPNSELGNESHVGSQVLQKLLQRGVSVSVRDHDGRQPLLWAASAEVRPSHVYCISGSADAILALINAGADVAAEDKDGLTALHCAASRGHVDCIDVLINFCNAEVDTMDSNGCTPLFYAVTLGHADCTEQLLKHGAIADRQDRKGRTPAHCGAAKGQLETLKLIHRRGADMWKKNIKGDLPLHEACQSGRLDLVLWLLSLQPESINIPNNDGRCPLHIAAINGSAEMCKVLLDSKATLNPIMRNSRGQLLTPVDAAVARGNREIAKYLHLHGGLPASKLTDKRALQLAMQKAVEAGPVIGRTGATPSEYTPETGTESSSPQLTKTPSTTILTPTMLAPNDVMQQQTGTNVFRQASVALQMGPSSFSMHSVDSQSQTEASPELHDAGTYTSEENTREEVLEEQRLGENTLAAENHQTDSAEDTQHQVTLNSDRDLLKEEKRINRANEENQTSDEINKEGNINKEEGTMAEKIQTNPETIKGEIENKDVSPTPEVDDDNKNIIEEKRADTKVSKEEVIDHNDVINEEIINNKQTKDGEHPDENINENLISNTEKVDSKLKDSRVSVVEESTVKEQNGNKPEENPENIYINDGKKEESKTEIDSEVVGSRTTETSSESSQPTVRSLIKSNSGINTKKKTEKIQIAKHDNVFEETQKKNILSENQEVEDDSERTKHISERKKDSSLNISSKGQKPSKDKTKSQDELETSKKGGESKTKSKQSVAVTGSGKVIKQKKAAKQTSNTARNGDNKIKDEINTNANKIIKRTKSEDPSSFIKSKGKVNKSRSKSFDKNTSKESTSKDDSLKSKQTEKSSLKTRKTQKSEAPSEVGTKNGTAEENYSQGGDSHAESGVSEGVDDQSNTSSQESLSSKEKTLESSKRTRSKLSVPERELGDGASEDGEAVHNSGNDSDPKNPSNTSPSKRKKVKRKRVSKTKQVRIESDVDKNGSCLSSPSSEEEDETGQTGGPRPGRPLSRPKTAVITNQKPKSLKDRPIIATSENLYSNDERTHELLLSSGRETGLVHEAPSDSLYSPSRLSLQDQHNFKVQKSLINASADSNESTSFSTPSSDEGNESSDAKSKSKRKIRKTKCKLINRGDTSKSINGEIHSDPIKGDDKCDSTMSQNLKSNEVLSKTITEKSLREELEGEMSRSGSDEEGGTDARKREIRQARSKRRKLKLLKASETKPTEHLIIKKDKREVGKRVLSGGPKKVETMDLSLKRKQSPATEMSITRAMQSTMRKYALERRLFQQLLDLKRLQIRNSRANEHVMIKRLVDEYNKEGNHMGLKDYAGPYNFQTYEKYLYDQLRMLQTSQGNKIPRFKPNDDVERLTRALRKANVPDLTQTLDDRENNAQNCNHTTHRCHHAIHAYTGVPCAAYLAQYNRNMKTGKVNLPRIPPSLPKGEVERKNEERNYDQKRPLKVELQHGSAKQQISLPSNFLDKNQRYQLTVSIQPSGKGEKKELNLTKETENLAKTQTMDSNPQPKLTPNNDPQTSMPDPYEDLPTTSTNVNLNHTPNMATSPIK